MAKSKGIIEIKKEWCKGCGICVDACSFGVLEMKGEYPEVVLLDKCTACGMCELLCPDFAIKVEKAEAAVSK